MRPPGALARPRSRTARGSVLNLLGQGGPVLGALIAAPRLITGLGAERFGLLTIAWVVVGYFSLFDLGLSRALTQVVAERIGERENVQAPPLVWPALAAMLGIGLAGASALALLAGPLVHSALHISPELQGEAVHTLYVLALGTPLVVVTAGLIGVLTAYHRFGILNAIRAPLGLFTFLSPLVVLPFSSSLVPIVSLLVAGRLLTFLAHLIACRSVLPPLRTAFAHRDSAITPLFALGVWMTVSNVLAPLLQYLDRFLIGAALSVTAVAYYATPYEIVTKLLIIPGSIVAALFPAFAATPRADHLRLRHLMMGGIKWVALLMFPLLLLVIAFAHEGLEWWLGAEFARQGAPVVWWLAIGVFVNGLGQVTITLIHAVGRPDISAKLHVLEVLIYLPLLWLALARFGIAGAAAMWTLRVALDACLLFVVSGRATSTSRGSQLRVISAFVGAVVCLPLPLLLQPLSLRLALVLLMLGVFVPVAWRFALAESERHAIKDRLRWSHA